MKYGCIADGKYFQVQCCAYILSLIVKDWINEVGESISQIRGAHVRSSPGKVLQFHACIDQKRITSKMSLF